MLSMYYVYTFFWHPLYIRLICWHLTSVHPSTVGLGSLQSVTNRPSSANFYSAVHCLSRVYVNYLNIIFTDNLCESRMVTPGTRWSNNIDHYSNAQSRLFSACYFLFFTLYLLSNLSLCPVLYHACATSVSIVSKAFSDNSMRMCYKHATPGVNWH